MPNDPHLDQLLNLARQHHAAGKLPQAEAMYRQVLAKNASHPDALHGMGLIAYQCAKSSIAVDLMKRAIAIDPTRAEFHYDLGRVLRDAGAFDEAIKAFEQALQLKPDFADAYNSMGTALKEQGRLEDAILSHRRALELQPDFAEAHNNLGRALHANGEIDEAVLAYRKAIALMPDFPPMHLNLGISLLTRGDLSQGWAEHEWRWRMKELSILHQNFTQPLWDGSNLNGRRILLHTDGGYGDTIQFARYAKLVAERGGKVILGCWPELKKLMSSLDGVEKVVTSGDSFSEFDVHCPLVTIPFLLKTTLETIPAAVPYLRADPHQSAKWRDKLADVKGMKVGIVWAGRQSPDPQRTIPAAELSSLSQIRGVSFVSLQKPEAGNLPSMLSADFRLIDWTSELTDFSETAALMDNLDLIITIDSAVAHLAGALGKRAWVLLKHVPDWRWLLHRRDCPWYPTMQLFRQPKRGDWQTPIQEIAKALTKESG